MALSKKKELEKTKTNYSSFEVDEAILKKEKSIQLIVVGIGFLVLAAILYF